METTKTSPRALPGVMKDQGRQRGKISVSPAMMGGEAFPLLGLSRLAPFIGSCPNMSSVLSLNSSGWAEPTPPNLLDPEKWFYQEQALTY